MRGMGPQLTERRPVFQTLQSLNREERLPDMLRKVFSGWTNVMVHHVIMGGFLHWNFRGAKRTSDTYLLEVWRAPDERH